MRKKKYMKKGITLSIILAMLITLLPTSFVQVAKAEVGDGNGYKDEMSHFILDSTTKTELGSHENDPELPNQFGDKGATVFYRYGSSELPVSGTTVGIKTTESIYVKVERMIKDSNGDWVVASETGNNTLIFDPSNPRDFSGVTNLNDGMNRLTFTGSSSDGIGTSTDLLYVRYDSNIFLNSMTIIDGNESVPLEGTAPSASVNEVITIEVNATNATRVILNGQEYSPFGDDTFLVGPVTLSQGLNTLNFELQNSEGTKQIYTREVYYYDPTTLLVDGEFEIDGVTKSAFYETPEFSLTIDPTTPVTYTGNLVGEILVPYSGNTSAQADDLESSITTTLSANGTYVSVDVLGNTTGDPSPEFVRGPNGVDDYAIFQVVITFDYAPTTANEIGSLTVESNYISIDEPSEMFFSFKVLDDSIIYIDTVSYRPTSGSDVALSSTTTTVSDEDAYSTTFVIAATDDLAGQNYTIATPYNVYTGTFDTTVESEKEVTLTDLPGGEYTVSFSIDGGGTPYEGRIRINTTPMIVFKNFADGLTLDESYVQASQSVEIELPNIVAADVLADSDDIGKSSLYINDSEIFTITDNEKVPDSDGDNDPATALVDYYLNGTNTDEETVTVESATDAYTIGTIVGETDKTTIIVDSVFLRRGSNTFEFTLYKDGRQVSQRTITFFIDTGSPEVTEFKPVLAKDRDRIDDEESWEDSDDISYSKETGNHTTNIEKDEEFDLLLQSYDVKQFELTMDGERVLTYSNGDFYDSNNVGVGNGDYFEVDGKSRQLEYDVEAITVNRERLTVRIEGLDFVQSDLHTFLLKLVNENGSMVTLPMEFRREALPYLVKYPVATVGKDIIVNRNYVPIFIKSENADEVIVDKEKAVFNAEENWFEYMFMDLKEDKWNEIDFTIVQGEKEIEGVIRVYYASSNQVGASNMLEFDRKIKALNDLVELEFEKGTVLRNREFVNDRKPLYEGHNLLIGIADPQNGLVEGEDYPNVDLNSSLRRKFSSLPDTFVPASPFVYINGGLGVEFSDEMPIKYGLQPHDDDYSFTDFDMDDRSLEPSQRGELTLIFDEGIRNMASPLVTVFRLNQDGRWENIGGVVKKNEITVPFDDFGYYVVMKWRGTYEDASNHPWARNSIEVMYAKGYMNAKQLGVEFGTVDPVTRGEFAQLLVKALGLPINADGEETFIDVKEGYSGRSGSLAHEDATWEYEYVETAARAGIVRGYSGNIFLPNKSLTREEASLMLAVALNLDFEKNDEDLREELLEIFMDGADISYYARPAVLAVHDAEIMEGARITSSTLGDDGPQFNFYPESRLTRAEAAVMITRVLINELKKLPKDFDTTNPSGEF
jgi:hypothetical protein